MKTFEEFSDQDKGQKILYFMKTMRTMMTNKVDNIFAKYDDFEYEHGPGIWFKIDSDHEGTVPFANGVRVHGHSKDEWLLKDIEKNGIKSIDDIVSVNIEISTSYQHDYGEPFGNVEERDDTKHFEPLMNDLQIAFPHATHHKPFTYRSTKGMLFSDTPTLKYINFSLNMNLPIPKMSDELFNVAKTINEDYVPTTNLYWELSSEAVTIIRSVLDLYNIKYTERNFMDGNDIDGKYNIENTHSFHIEKGSNVRASIISVMAGENNSNMEYYFDGSNNPYVLIFDDNPNTDGEFIPNGRDLMDSLQKSGANMYNIMKQVNETKATPDNILDHFNDRQKKFKWGEYDMEIKRTKGSYKVVSYHNDKSVGRIYIQEIRETNKGFKAQLRRLHVSDNYRKKGLGRKLLETAIKTFSDIELYGHASPNRIKGLEDSNREEYRSGLVNFYSSVGLQSTGSGARVERKPNKISGNIK